ncbi:MAG: hypothetical protein ACK559_10240, partial [bacterium]
MAGHDAPVDHPRRDIGPADATEAARHPEADRHRGHQRDPRGTQPDPPRRPPVGRLRRGALPALRVAGRRLSAT